MNEHKVLVIENDLFFYSKIQEALKGCGFLPVLSCDLQGTLKVLGDSGIALVVVDLSIDRFDSLGLLHQLKSSPQTCHIPVIAFAEHSEKKLLQAAREAGCEVVVSNRSLVKDLKDLLEMALPDASM